MATPERRTKEREGDSGIGVLFSRRMMFNTSLGGGADICTDRYPLLGRI